MNKSDLLELWAVLTNLQKVKANVKFSYAVAKNRMKIKPEIEALQDATKPADEFMKYERKRMELAQKFADKDAEGRIKIDNGNFVITKNISKFNERLASLKDEHADAIAAQEKLADEIESLLKERFEFEPHKVEMSMFPEEIEPEVFEVFLKCDLIKDVI